MGLAASQARFLGITLRKANLEFKSTELAQQRMQLTNQMSQISEDYASAINATKLSWINEDIDGSFGFTYGLLMTPSVANDYNPFMVTTKSGAIVLNSGYRGAAVAAGIPMAGTIPSDAEYKKFIIALGVGDSDIEGQNIITKPTQQTLLGMHWHATAGMGAIPKDKSYMSQSTLNDLINDEEFGGQIIDWLQVYRQALGYEYDDKATNGTYNAVITVYDNEIAMLKRRYANAEIPGASGDKTNFGTTVAKTAQTNAENAVNIKNASFGTDGYLQITSGTDSAIMDKFINLEKRIAESSDTGKVELYTKELNNYINGLDVNGNEIGTSAAERAENKLKNRLFWSVYEKAKFVAANKGNSSDVINWADDSEAQGTATTIGFDRIFYTGSQSGVSGRASEVPLGASIIPDPDGAGKIKSALDDNVFAQLNLYINDVQERSEGAIKSLTLGDLLTNDVVLISHVHNDTLDHVSQNGNNGGGADDTAIKSIETAAKGVLDYISRVFGYDSIGTGLNIDNSTNEALNYAYAMTMKKFVDARGAVKAGTKDDDTDMHNNSAYINANNYNKIGVMNNDHETYAAINLSNMVSAFLTYYDNALRGAESDYVVGKGNDGGADGRTFFVTDDPDYVYLTNTEGAMTNDEKINDFYCELYNSICEHGWRYDGNLDDYEYLENSIKDGRYALSALNADGYFYQARYNDIEYIVEESDRDAIARAEADFTRKKAEITAKEDKIDIRTKKLDAEIAELTTELNSVQNLITKSIEKTFALFSN